MKSKSAQPVFRDELIHSLPRFVGHRDLWWSEGNFPQVAVPPIKGILAPGSVDRREMCCTRGAANGADHDSIGFIRNRWTALFGFFSLTSKLLRKKRPSAS